MKTALAAFLLALGSPALALERSTDTLVYVTGRHWNTLDPANAADAVGAIIVANVYESLITAKSLDDLDSFEPFLASEVPTVENGLLSKDRRTYSFPIRKGVHFHDGSLLTPEDVRYSILRYMLTDSDGGNAALLLKPILGVYGTRNARGNITVNFKDAAEAVSVKGDRVVIRLKQPDGAFLKILASLPVIVSKNWAAVHKDWDGREETWKQFNGRGVHDTYLDDHMNGTGPFEFDKIDPDSRALVLTRHEGYWRKPAALKKVLLKVESNGAMRLFMLQAGDADAAYLENTYHQYLKSLKGIRLVEELRMHHIGDVFFLTFETDPADNDLLGSGELNGKGIPPGFFADPDVRRGLAYSFDYEKYFKAALGLRGRRTSGPFPADLLSPSGEAAYQYDPEKAAAAFKKAFGGALWANGFILPVAYHADSATREVAAEVLKASLEKLNSKFKVHPYPLPGAVFYRELKKRRLPLYLTSYFADYPDPQAFAVGLLHSRGYFAKYQGYADPEADALIEKAAASADPRERRDLYLKLAAVASRDVPQIYTYSPQDFKACRDWVEGCDSNDNVNDLNFNSFPYFYALSIKPPQGAR